MNRSFCSPLNVNHEVQESNDDTQCWSDDWSPWDKKWAYLMTPAPRLCLTIFWQLYILSVDEDRYISTAPSSGAWLTVMKIKGKCHQYNIHQCSNLSRALSEQHKEACSIKSLKRNRNPTRQCVFTQSEYICRNVCTYDVCVPSEKHTRVHKVKWKTSLYWISTSWRFKGWML